MNIVISPTDAGDLPAPDKQNDKLILNTTCKFIK